MDSVHTLCVSTHSFPLLVEVNGPEKADVSNIIIGNSCVVFGCTNRSGSGVVFHKIPCDKERHKVWLIALKLAYPPNLKYRITPHTTRTP